MVTNRNIRERETRVRHGKHHGLGWVESRMSVSVVIPCHNAAPWLASALDSVFGQTCRPDEVIVVDDGSSDDSAAIARGFSPEVICLAQPNQGISAARNRGIAHAHGDLLAFLDADDVWPRESLARRVEALARNPSWCCVFGQVEQFREPGGQVDQPRHGRLAGAMLARRSLFDRVGLFDRDLRIGETLDWIARLDESGLPRGTVDDVVLRRRIHGTNTVRDPNKQSDYLKALRAALQRRRGAEKPA